MKLSVIIPCYNADKTLEIQLNALARQEFPDPWEVILSDNGSTDHSKSIASRYSDRLPNFRIVDASAVKGPAHARNEGAKAASGESLLFCDADDEVAPGWLCAMADALEKHDFVTCRFEPYKLNDAWTLNYRSCPQENELQSYRYPPYLPHAASAGIGVKRAIHERMGGFDETMYMLEDTDYCWRIQLEGIELKFVPEALIHYRYRNSIVKILRQARLWGEYNVYLYRKYQSFGMPKLSKKGGIRRTFTLLQRLPSKLSGKKERAQLLWQFVWQYGRLIGCIKYRVFAL